MKAAQYTRWLRFLPVLCLVCPYLYFLNEESANLFIPSIVVSICILVVLGVAISVIVHRWPKTLQLIVVALLLVPLSDQLISVSFVRQTLMVWVLVVLLPIVVLKRHIVFPLMVFLSVTSVVSLVYLSLNGGDLVSTFSQSEDTPDVDSVDLPAVVHVVLDEMTSVDHLSANLSDRHQIASRVTESLAENQFTLGENVFSRSFNTVHSLSSLVNFDWKLESYISQFLSNPNHHELNTVTDSVYFDLMSSMGYEITVFESEFLDFCATGKHSKCVKYKSSGINALGLDSIRVSVGLKVLLRKYLSSMKSSSYVLNWFSRTQLVDPAKDKILVDFSNWDIYESPLIAYRANQALLDELHTLKSGEMIFAHLLIPHFTYFFDRECVPKNDGFFRNYVLSNTAKGNSPESRARRYEEYSKQYQCALLLVDQIIDAVPNRDEVLFIFHGDHGARIAETDTLDSSSTGMNRYVLNDFYDTFFAVRYPFSLAGETISDVALEQALLKVLKKVYLDQIPGRLMSNDRLVYSQTDPLLQYPNAEEP